MPTLPHTKEKPGQRKTWWLHTPSTTEGSPALHHQHSGGPRAWDAGCSPLGLGQAFLVS